MSTRPAAELAGLDATAQAELVAAGEVSPRELVDAAIDRIERVDPRLNAVIHPRFERARAEADGHLPDGPFRGVPILIKDLVCRTAGDPYHCGMAFLKRQRWTADHDSFLATRLRAAGFIVVGRTNVPELGPVPTTEPHAYGATRNPWDPTRSPAGSSGGSAAAVAAGMVPVAHGNDGGGSIRVPASACGLVGLKPSRGRTSLGPDAGDLWNGLVAEHVLTCSVRDTAAILDQLHGWMPGDPYTAPAPSRAYRDELLADPGRLRIGLLTHAPARVVEVDADCVAAARAAARTLASLGHTVEETYPEVMDDPEFMRAFGDVVRAATARDLDYWASVTGTPIGEDDVEPATWQLATLGRELPAAEYLGAIAYLQQYTRRVAGWFAAGFDLLLTPTIAEPPTVLGSFDLPSDNPLHSLFRSSALIAFSGPFNATGQPAVSLPLHWNAGGLPIGIQLVAAYGREDVLIRVAAQLETAVPWRERRPAIHA